MNASVGGISRPFHSSNPTVKVPYSVNPYFANNYYQPWSQPMWYDDMYLPRPEFARFSGNPLQFRTFMNNVERHIATKVRDTNMLLCYLPQHCEDPIKNKLQHFSTKAMQVLPLLKNASTGNMAPRV